MSFKSLFLLIIGIAILAFVGLNWPAMSTPTNLSLGFTEIRAPLGLVLLGLMALLSVVFVALVAYTQGTVLVETRRHAKELAAQRELADKAEASRFTDLRAHLDKEITRVTEAMSTQTRETLSRVDRAEMGLREGLAGYVPAPASVRPAALTGQPSYPTAVEDPVGNAVPR